MQDGKVMVLPDRRRPVHSLQAVETERQISVLDASLRQQRRPPVQCRGAERDPPAGITLAEMSDNVDDGLLPRRLLRSRSHCLVVRPRPAFPCELQVGLELAVQEGFDDVPSDLGRHVITLRATLCDLLATIAEM